MDYLEELSETNYEVKLRKRFPISKFAILRRCVKFFFICISLSYLSLAMLNRINSLESFKEYNILFNQIFLGFNFLIAISLVIKITYEILFHNAYYYAIQDGHLVISSGVFLKQRAAYPITAISDVYLDRKFLDFIFGLYNVHISNPSLKSHEFGDIKGLCSKNGVLIQDYLKQLNQKIVPENKKANYFTPENLRTESTVVYH